MTVVAVVKVAAAEEETVQHLDFTHKIQVHFDIMYAIYHTLRAD